MNDRMKLAAIAALLTLVAGAEPARAATLTVPTEYSTIQWAIDSARPGDTVRVLAGTYGEENLQVKDQVDLVGDGAGVTFLTGTTPLRAGSGGTIAGFTLVGRGIEAASKSPVIRDNVIRNHPGAGIVISGNAWAVVYRNLVFNGQGGIQSNYTSAIVNNTIAFNAAGYGLVYPGGEQPTANNLVVHNYMGIVDCSAPRYGGGYNLAWRNWWTDWRCIGPGAGDLTADPLFAKAPRDAAQAYQVDSTELGADTLRIQWDWTARVLVGDHVEIGYDGVDRVVTEVTRAFDSYDHTRIRVSPPLPGQYGAPAVLVWGDTSDFTYDFSLRPGSPAIDGGDPDPSWNDADGTRNDIGATGGLGYPPIWDGVAPGPVAGLVVAPGDGELRLTWTPPAAADVMGYLVLRRSGAAAPTGVPSAGASYAAASTGSNRWLGDGYVVHAGPEAAFVDADRQPGVTYTYAVFAFDRFYNYSAPVTGAAASFHTPRTFTVNGAGGADFTTVAGAMAAARATDVILVAPGTYVESFTFRSGVVLRGQSRDGTILALPEGAYSVVQGNGVVYGAIENLTIAWTGPRGWNNGIWLEGGAAIDLLDVTVRGFAVGAFYRGDYWSPAPPERSATIRGCLFDANDTSIWLWYAQSPDIRENVFQGVPGAGVGINMKYSVTPEISFNEFRGMGIGVYVWERSRPLIHDNRITGGGTGISHAWSSNSVIYRNVISDNTGNGISSVSYSSPSVQGNVVARNGGDGMWFFFCWPQAVNNTIVGNAGNGILTQYYAGVDIRNNVIAFNGGWGTSAGEGYYSSNPMLRYNDLFGNAAGNTSPLSNVFEGNVFADPRLRDLARGDYQLASGSPAIDAGDPDPAYDDLDGTRNDMGAFGGPRGIPRDPPPVDEQVAAIGAAVIALPDNAFRGEAANRKEAMENKLNAVLEDIEAALAQPDPAARQAALQAVLAKLKGDLLAKCDGWFGGNKKNDWIVTKPAQAVVYPIIVSLIGEVEILLRSP